MPLFQYAGLRLNFNCCLSGFNMLVSSLIFSQAVQTLGSIAVVSAGDIGYIGFVLIPGYVPFMPGALGPILWILAVIFSTIGLMSAAKGERVT
jgi:hypothetical protein